VTRRDLGRVTVVLITRCVSFTDFNVKNGPKPTHRLLIEWDSTRAYVREASV